MLESLKRSSTLNHQLLAISCSIALVALCTSSISSAQAAYEYSQVSTVPEALFGNALIDATRRGDVTFPKMAEDLEKFKTQLKDRRTRLGSVIATGQSRGYLTAAQADTLRSELDVMSALDNQLSGTSVPANANLAQVAKILQLAMHYDKTQLHLKNVLDTYDTELASIDPVAVIAAVKSLESDSSSSARAELETKISTELVSGTLTSSEGAKLRDKLNRVAGREVAMRNGNGTLETDEQAKVDSELKKLSASFNSSVDM